jgi:polyketide cyclase/dehydrase/lipid transport protein
MRRVELAFLVLGILIINASPASAIEVKRRTEVPGDFRALWSAAGEFCAIKDWHPLVAGCKETKEGADTFRILTLKDGGKIKEKLTDQEGTSYSYEIVESPLPVKNYKAKFWVEPDDEPDRTAVYWEADFDANGASDDEARKKVFDVMVAGMKGIKQLALQKNPGASDHD